MPFSVFSTEADKDYLLARTINLAGSGFASRAGYFAHQSCEKYLKAILVQERQQYPQTHMLVPLAEQCAAYHGFFSEIETVRVLKIFDEFEQVGRYGGASNFDPKSQKTEAFETAGVMFWSSDYIDMLDSFVFRARSLLDFEKIQYGDALKMLLNGDKKNIYSASWTTLRPPISVILRKNNKAFKPHSE